MSLVLKLVQSFCCSYDAKTQGVMATVASHKRPFTHYQKDTVNNHTYHWEFLTHIKTIETYGGVGVVGVVPTFLATKIKELADARMITDADNSADVEPTIAVAAIVRNIWPPSCSAALTVNVLEISKWI
jgi:hypothetical protein